MLSAKRLMHRKPRLSPSGLHATSWPRVQRTKAHPIHVAHVQSQEVHQQGLDNLRAAMEQTRILCATVMDTLGPEIVVVNR